MTSLRPFSALDIFKFNPTNLDPLTETYGLDFYYSYIARWPHLFSVAEGEDGTIDAYSTFSSVFVRAGLQKLSCTILCSHSFISANNIY